MGRLRPVISCSFGVQKYINDFASMRIINWGEPPGSAPSNWLELKGFGSKNVLVARHIGNLHACEQKLDPRRGRNWFNATSVQIQISTFYFAEPSSPFHRHDSLQMCCGPQEYGHRIAFAASVWKCFGKSTYAGILGQHDSKICSVQLHFLHVPSGSTGGESAKNSCFWRGP